MPHAVDTSVVIPTVDETHAFHAAVLPLVLERRPVLAGHAAFEAFSVLTRRPPPRRLSPANVSETLAENFGEPCWLTAEGSARVYRLLGEGRIAGGAVFDALVAQAALDHERVLMTRDRRAQRAYDIVGVHYELLR